MNRVRWDHVIIVNSYKDIGIKRSAERGVATGESSGSVPRDHSATALGADANVSATCPSESAIRFGTTVGGWGSERFANRSRRIEVPPRLDHLPRGPFRPLDELTLLLRVLRAAWSEDVLLLFSSRGYLKPEVLAAVLIGCLPRSRRPQVILYGEMFQPNQGLRGVLESWVMKLADRSISRYVVHTAAEIHVFAENWGIAKEKIRSSGFYLRTDDDETGRASHPRKEHIFAGGTSFRDYEALLEAARLLPHRQFVIGSHQLHDHPRIPPNVEAGPVSRERFFELINTAAVVVVPLRTDVRRIIGMLTYLKAMWLRKPTIVSQALGVEEFIDDGENGLIVDGSPQSYATAIEWVLDPAHKTRVDTLCDRAHESVRTLHTVERHVARLLSVVDETARENRLLRGSHPPA